MKQNNNINAFHSRLLLSFPGIISWLILSASILVILFKPTIFVVFIILFSIYWTINCSKIVFHAYRCHKRVEDARETDWLKKLKKDFPKEWESHYYCALIPFASESENVLRPTIESIVDSNFPKRRKILCLSSEKALPKGKIIAKKIQKEFKKHFAYIFVTEHELKPGEMKGKSSNQNHCGRFLYKKMKSLGIDPAKVLLTSNDADVLNDKEYHAYLLHSFLNEGKMRHKRIYQPIPTDFTNYWHAKFFSRIIIITGALWRMALQQINNYRCTVYAFYSMSLKMLHDLNYWDVDLIPEDERTMFKALFKYGKLFKVIPIYLTTSGTPVQGSTLKAAFLEQYKQIRRWAWGASEFAHSVQKAMSLKKVDYNAVILPIFNQIRTSTEWALSSILLMIGGFLPGIINPNFAQTEIAQIYPIILSSILSLTTLLIIMIINFELKFIPKKPEDAGILFYMHTIVQWVSMPFIGVFLSSIPAIEAQTRLIINRPIVYIESKKE